jgi:hypothetical protein
MLRDLYAMMVAEFGDSAPWDLNPRALWVMDLDSYKQVRATARAAGAVYPDDGVDDPGPEDCLFGVRVDVRDGGGTPHLEIPGHA